MPLETLNAYATIAADGKYCAPIPVVDIYEANGTKLANVSEPQCKQAVKPEIARAAIDAARCPVYDQGFFGGCDGGTARDVDGQTVREVVGRPIAGKTGTSDVNWTANLFLVNKQLAVGGTLANPDYAQTEHDGTAARKVNTAVSRTMRDAIKGLPRVNFIAPPRDARVRRTGPSARREMHVGPGGDQCAAHAWLRRFGRPATGRLRLRRPARSPGPIPPAPPAGAAPSSCSSATAPSPPRRRHRRRPATTTAAAAGVVVAPVAVVAVAPVAVVAGARATASCRLCP